MVDDPQLAAYRQVGIGVAPIELGRAPAVVVVDMQRHFTEGVLASPRTETVLAATAQLLERAREAGVPVFHLRVVYRSPAEVGVAWRQKCPSMSECLAGSRPAEIHPLVAPLAGETVIDKRRASGFFETELDQVLKAAAVDTVVVVGTSTSGCVRATAVDGAALDYRVIVVEDCVDDRAEASHAAALTDVQAKYGEVLSLDQLARELSRTRTQPDQRGD
ncbi:MAG: isochorismatase family protein [Actinobacteria bacterium]|nr:isochorismatase family protein [Actinomycetota bacterium]